MASDINRIVQVPIPVRALERIDALVAGGDAGYGNRTEFVREAISQLLDVAEAGLIGEPESEPDSLSSTPPTHLDSMARVAMARPSSDELHPPPVGYVSGVARPRHRG